MNYKRYYYVSPVINDVNAFCILPSFLRNKNSAAIKVISHSSAISVASSFDIIILLKDNNNKYRV